MVVRGIALFALVLSCAWLSASVDDIDDCIRTRSNALNCLINEAIQGYNTDGELFDFISSEISLRAFCQINQVDIEEDWNFTTRLALGRWEPEAYQYGVINLVLKDQGLKHSYKEILCNRSMEVKNACP